MIASRYRGKDRSAYTLLELMIVLAILVTVMAVAWPRITGQLQTIGPREAALQLKGDLEEAREQAVLTGEAWAVRIERGQARYEIGPVAEFRSRQQSSLGVQGLRSSVEAQLGLTEASLPTTGGGSLSGSTLTATPVGRIEPIDLPIGMIFDDGVAHSTQDVNAVRVDPNGANAVATAPSTVPNAALFNPGTGVVPANLPVDPNAMPAMVDPMNAPPATSQDTWKYVVVFQPDGRATESEVRLKEQLSESKIRLRVRGFTGAVTIDAVERKQKLLPQEMGLEGETLFEGDAQGDPQADALGTPGVPASDAALTPAMTPAAYPSTQGVPVR